MYALHVFYAESSCRLFALGFLIQCKGYKELPRLAKCFIYGSENTPPVIVSSCRNWLSDRSLTIAPGKENLQTCTIFLLVSWRVWHLKCSTNLGRADRCCLASESLGWLLFSLALFQNSLKNHCTILSRGRDVCRKCRARK